MRLLAPLMFFALSSSGTAATFTLYDGNQPGTPDTQGFLNFGSVGTGTQAAGGGQTALNTTSPSAFYAGYTNYNFTISAGALTPVDFANPVFPVLDRSAGFTLHFTAQVLNDISGPNRAGFSVIALGSDKKGVEIGFQAATIFAQSDNPLFGTPAESNSDPSIATRVSTMTPYDLTIQGDTYLLATSSFTILTGNVKDYTAASGAFGNVYRTPSLLFLGDDTTSASALTNIQAISLDTAAPETAAPLSGLIALAGLFLIRSNRTWLSPNSTVNLR
jgi:hypothetical protein